MSDRIALFPLHTMLFPHSDLGLHVFEERYRELVSHCLGCGDGFGVVLIKRGRDVETPEAAPAQSHPIGTLAHIAGYARLPDGRFLLEVEGSKRFTIHSLNGGGPYPRASVTWMTEPIGNFAEARSQSVRAEQLFRTYRRLNGDGEIPVQLPVDPVARSYILASLLDIDVHEKQQLLGTAAADDRLALETKILRREIALLDHVREERR